MTQWQYCHRCVVCGHPCALFVFHIWFLGVPCWHHWNVPTAFCVVTLSYVRTTGLYVHYDTIEQQSLYMVWIGSQRIWKQGLDVSVLSSWMECYVWFNFNSIIFGLWICLKLFCVIWPCHNFFYCVIWMPQFVCVIWMPQFILLFQCLLTDSSVWLCWHVICKMLLSESFKIIYLVCYWDMSKWNLKCIPTQACKLATTLCITQ